jgi:hypothetical protein
MPRVWKVVEPVVVLFSLLLLAIVAAFMVPICYLLNKIEAAEKKRECEPLPPGRAPSELPHGEM